MTFKLYRFFKVIFVDDDYDDDINDGDILMTVNSYMKNDGDVDGDRMYVKLRC